MDLRSRTNVELEQPSAFGAELDTAGARDVGSGNGIVDFGRHRVRGCFGGRRDRTGTAARVAGELYDGRPKGHDRRRCWADDASPRARARLVDLDGIRRVLDPEAPPPSVQTLAITDLKLDEAFQDYGPEAAEGHRILREGIKNTIAEIWGGSNDEEAVIHKFGYARANLKARTALLNTLQPASDQQTAAKTEATQAAIAIDQTLSQMALALVDPIAYSLISVVVGWAAFLFCGYGLLSKRHPMSYVVLVVGAMGIASAIYIIADLSSPFSGVFAVSPAPLVDVLKVVEEAAAPAGSHR